MNLKIAPRWTIFLVINQVSSKQLTTILIAFDEGLKWASIRNIIILLCTYGTFLRIHIMIFHNFHFDLNTNILAFSNHWAQVSTNKIYIKIYINNWWQKHFAFSNLRLHFPLNNIYKDGNFSLILMEIVKSASFLMSYTASKFRKIKQKEKNCIPTSTKWQNVDFGGQTWLLFYIALFQCENAYIALN